MHTGKLLSTGLEFESFAAQIEAGSYAAVLIFIYDPSREEIFGHWIIIAGINKTGHYIIISDPYFDKESPTMDPLLHNNVAIVSHDQYHINTTNPFSEDGPWWIEEYVPNCYTIVSAAVVITPLSKTIITKPATGHLSVLNKTCFRTLLEAQKPFAEFWQEYKDDEWPPQKCLVSVDLLKQAAAVLEQDLPSRPPPSPPLRSGWRRRRRLLRPFVEEFKTWDTHTPVDEYYCEGDPAVFKVEDLERAAAWLDSAK